MPAHLSSAEDVNAALEQVAYLADEGLATATFLALELDRPSVPRGRARRRQDQSRASPWPRSSAVSSSGCSATRASTRRQALYDWDFPRQLLHLRAAEASGITDPAATEASLYDRRFLLARPILRALETSTRSTAACC